MSATIPYKTRRPQGQPDLLADNQPSLDRRTAGTQTTPAVLDDDMDDEVKEPYRLRRRGVNILSLIDEHCKVLAMVVLCLQLLAGVLMAILSTLVMSDLPKVLEVYVQVLLLFISVVVLHRTGILPVPHKLLDMFLAGRSLYTIIVFAFGMYWANDAHRSMWRALETSVVALWGIAGLCGETSEKTYKELRSVAVNNSLALLLEGYCWRPEYWYSSHAVKAVASRSPMLVVYRIYSLNPAVRLMVAFVMAFKGNDTTIVWTTTYDEIWCIPARRSFSGVVRTLPLSGDVYDVYRPGHGSLPQVPEGQTVQEVSQMWARSRSPEYRRQLLSGNSNHGFLFPSSAYDDLASDLAVCSSRLSIWLW